MTELIERRRKLLDGRHYATLATHDADGAIHLTPVWYLFRDEQLFVAAPSFSRKARNASTRATASLIVDIRKPGHEQWVSGAGPVTMLRGDESRRINAAIHERYLTAVAIAEPRIGPAFAGVDDVTLSIRPTVWRSWSAADADAQFFAGILGASPQKWFLPVDV